MCATSNCLVSFILVCGVWRLDSSSKIMTIVAIVIAASWLLFSVVFAQEKSCSTKSNNKNVPCVEIPSCLSGAGMIEINLLSSGLIASGKSTVSMCYTDQFLNITHAAFDQKYFTTSPYTNCNSEIYLLDVVEAFVAPDLEESGPLCYSEIDVSIENVMFESGIINPNLNHTGISGQVLECSSSGIQHETFGNREENLWTSSVQIPWSVLNCPRGCPYSAYCDASSDLSKPLGSYRANFFRLNELEATSKCTSTLCDYMAWSPNFVSPPAFHEPLYFGYLVLV